MNGVDEFERLLNDCHRALSRYVRSRISNQADADDILQEVSVAAFQSFSALRRKEAFLPWLLGIARRKCADHYRAKARRPEVPCDALPDQIASDQADHGVDETLERLPERDRMMLRLFYYEGLSQKTISEQLNVPEGTVKSRMSAARARFRAAYPYPPKGGMMMKNKTKLGLPAMLPEYTIQWRDEPPFSVDCEELMGWFIVPRLGEKCVWGMYDLPSRKLDVSYENVVTGRASVHGLEGVQISAKAVLPDSPAGADDLMDQAVSESTGGVDEWQFIAQIKDGYTRFLAAERVENGVRKISTFLDGDEFLNNWGFGEDNCGMPIHLTPRGLIVRTRDAVTAADGALMDLVGRCTVTLNGAAHDTVCLMDLGMYYQGMVSEQYIDRSGHTVLWRRFNRDDWEMDRYGKAWSALLPDNERLIVNGQKYVHWYDCLCLR